MPVPFVALMSNRMKFLSKILFAALGITAVSYLSAQTEPAVFYGPYEEPSARQFIGEWMRSDGTYRMVISGEADGLKAQYFNPSPINVESTAVVEVEDGLSLNVVLRDEGYPGSSYTLQYIPQYRVLVGTYTIPGQAPAEVYFTK